MKTTSLAIIAFVLLTGAAVSVFQHDNSIRSLDLPGQARNAAYRDGRYQGLLAARRGSAPEYAIGRWNAAEDRASFLTGYERGYNETRSTAHDTTHATSAAFRDGLYLGSLEAERGDQPHLSIGRWSTHGDRSLFSEGYRQGYLLSVVASGPTHRTMTF